MHRSKFIGKRKYYLLNIIPGDQEGNETTFAQFSVSKEKIDLVLSPKTAPLEMILPLIPKCSETIVIFSGGHLLTRFIKEEGINQFEEIEPGNFYLQSMESADHWTLQSICRRSVVDPVIDLILSRGIFVCDISLSPVVLLSLEKMISAAEIVTDDIKISFINGLVHSIDKVQVKDNFNWQAELGGTEYSKNSIMLPAALIKYLEVGAMDLKFIREQNQQARFYNLFKKVGMISLTGLFFLLLLNFMLFGIITNNIDQLHNSGENISEKINEIELLKSSLNEYKGLVKHDSSREAAYSFLIDRIGIIRSDGIWLNSLELDPLLAKQEQEKNIQPNHDMIIIAGETAGPSPLNTFINALNREKWVKDVQLNFYKKSQDRSLSEFRIKVIK